MLRSAVAEIKLKGEIESTQRMPCNENFETPAASEEGKLITVDTPTLMCKKQTIVR